MVDVDHLEFEELLSAERQQLAGEVSGAVGCLLDGLDFMVHGAARFQLLQQHLGVSVDHHQQVVEVVGDAAGEAADGIHFLRLAVGDIFGDQLQHFFGFLGATGGAAAEPHNDDPAVFASPLHFHAIQTAGEAVVLGQLVQFLRIDEDFAPRIEFEKSFDRPIPQHGDECRIHVQESSAESAAANSESGAQYQRAGAGFGAAQRLFIALVLDGRGQLLRNKFQNFAIPLPETGILAIALDDHDPNAAGAALQRNTQPVHRRSADQLHFAAPHQFLKDSRCRQQGLARSQDIFRQTAAQGLWDGRRILFIDEVGKAQQLRLRIVEGDIEVARIHQLAHDVVNGGKKLLQIFGRLAARRDGVQSGIQLLGAFLIGDVAIGGIRSHAFAVHHDG